MAVRGKSFMTRTRFKVLGIVLVAGLVAFQRFEVMIKMHELTSVQYELNGRENEVRMLTARAGRMQKEWEALKNDARVAP